MKLIAHLTVELAVVGRTLFDELVSLCPGGIGRPDAIIFCTALDESDAQLRRLLDRLESAGFVPRGESRPRDRTKEYGLEYRRHYDEADLRNAPLVMLGFTYDHPPAKCEVSNERGEFVIKRQPARDISYVFCSCFTIVSDRVRRAIEEEGFGDDAIFLPTESLEQPHEPYWELRSRRTLPSVSPSMQLFDAEGNPFDGDYSKQWFAREGLYRPAELHYRAEDLHELGPFDLAHTKERFEYGLDALGYLIASAPFYDMCRRQGFDGGFMPVRIDG